MRCKTIMMMNKKLTLAESFTGAAHCEAVEIYEWVHLVVTLHSETQQVVILLCPPTTEAGASVYSGQITVDSGQWRKTGEQEGPIHAWSLPTRPNSMSNTQMHPGALKKKKEVHISMQTQTRSFKLSAFFARPWLFGKQRRRRTIVLWPISGPDIGKQEEIPPLHRGVFLIPV